MGSRELLIRTAAYRPINMQINVRHASLAVKQKNQNVPQPETVKTNENSVIDVKSDNVHPGVYTSICEQQNCWHKACALNCCKTVDIFKTGNISDSTRGFDNSSTIKLENEKNINYVAYDKMNPLTKKALPCWIIVKN